MPQISVLTVRESYVFTTKTEQPSMIVTCELCNATTPYLLLWEGRKRVAQSNLIMSFPSESGVLIRRIIYGPNPKQKQS